MVGLPDHSRHEALPPASAATPHEVPPGLSPSGWQQFAARHPGAAGYFQVSGTGYSLDRRRAVVYVSQRCGIRCGTTWLVALTASRGRWRVQAVQRLMVL